MSALTFSPSQPLTGCEHKGKRWVLGGFGVALAYPDDPDLPENPKRTVSLMLGKFAEMKESWTPIQPVTIGGHHIAAALTAAKRQVYVFDGGDDRVFLNADALDEIADRAATTTAKVKVEQLGKEHTSPCRVKAKGRIVGWIMPVKITGESWDAYLTDDRGHCEGDWNYTHNTNRHIAAALATLGEEVPVHWLVGATWWDRLNGMSGPDGAAYLDSIIKALEADPETYRALDPKNGWGGYDSLLPVLRHMVAAVPEWPTVWSVSG